MHNLKKTVALIGFASASWCGVATVAHAADPAYTLTSNVSLVSDYYFRGLTQTWHKPAIQGGADLSLASGWYAGTWLSNVSGNQYSGGSLEWDYYGGYNGKINDDWGWTAGLYGYYYPGANVNKSSSSTVDQRFNTLEWNAGVSYKWVSFKYSQSLTDYFGINKKTGFTSDSKGSSYMSLDAAIPLPYDLSLGLHVGHTNVKADLVTPTVGGSTNPDYNDYKIGLTKSFKDGWNVGVAYVKASNGAFYDKTSSLANSDTADLGEGRVVLSAGRTF